MLFKKSNKPYYYPIESIIERIFKLARSGKTHEINSVKAKSETA